MTDRTEKNKDNKKEKEEKDKKEEKEEKEVKEKKKEKKEKEEKKKDKKKDEKEKEKKKSDKGGEKEEKESRKGEKSDNKSEDKDQEEASSKVTDPSKWENLCPIARPLADKKLTVKALKLVKRATKNKQIRKGVKEVVKAIRKGQKGICLLAGNISPVDVLSHIPLLCEENSIPYVYVPSREDLGAAGMSKRPTSCLLVMPKPVKGELAAEEADEFSKEYSEIAKDAGVLLEEMLVDMDTV